ncbi:TetR/AcrR family transcriptional regulator [Pendulispora rubella]|uniref:TetR/AcrR family transcriptional regulator n=1 Tax=Pendulispora rubella TaxID=2741070 RepID=A0ABZ2L0L4_9BACT
MGRLRMNDPEGMRNRVLDAAAEAFQARGYHATSMHDVMKAAEMSGGALYHHFPTKKDLALAVIRERVAAAVEATWIAPVQRARRATDGIAAVFASIITELTERGAVRGCPLANLGLELSLADPQLRAAVQAVYDTWRTALAEKFRADKVAGDPDGLATFVISAYSGAMALAKAEQSPAPLQTCIEQLTPSLAPRGKSAAAAGKLTGRSRDREQ